MTIRTKAEKKLKIERLKQRILPILKQHQVSKAAIFGSMATGTDRKTSDLNLLIELGKKRAFLTW